VVAPGDAVAQLVARKDTAATAREKRQELELRMRERYFASVLIDERTARQIERSSLKPQDRCRYRLFACPRLRDFRKQTYEPLLIDRLGQHVGIG
jgi:hypothetical protein